MTTINLVDEMPESKDCQVSGGIGKGKGGWAVGGWQLTICGQQSALGTQEHRN
jgi:hypothetical protein